MVTELRDDKAASTTLRLQGGSSRRMDTACICSIHFGQSCWSLIGVVDVRIRRMSSRVTCHFNICITSRAWLRLGSPLRRTVPETMEAVGVTPRGGWSLAGAQLVCLTWPRCRPSLELCTPRRRGARRVRMRVDAVQAMEATKRGVWSAV